MLNKDVICRAAERYASFYLYEEKTIIEHTTALKKYFPSVDFLYSVKCNPNGHVASCVFAQGFGADAASFGEVEISLACGLPKEKIFYSAPGKSKTDIQNACGKAVIIADSIGEIEKIKVVAQSGPMEIGIRLNPEFTYAGNGGVPSKFGIDEQAAIEYIGKMSDTDPVKITGIHVHVKSQELSAEVINRYYQNVFALADRIEAALGHQLSYINFGSGIGIPYAPDDRDVDVAWLGSQMEQHIAQYRLTHPTTQILIEVGRYAVGKSGVYVTHVVDKKVSHGKTFILLQNTLNGFVRPSLERMVEKYTNDAAPAATEPLFTGRNSFEYKAFSNSTQEERVTLVGNLCTAADVIAEDILLPKLEEGDIVAITNAGGYAAVLTPMQFASLEKPEQIFLALDGELRN